MAKSTKNVLFDDDYLIIGFDTEFKTPDIPPKKFDPDGIYSPEDYKYTVLSYQFYCSFEGNIECEWEGIIYPKNNERISFEQYIETAIDKGFDEKKIFDVPSNIILACHFTRADIPSFVNSSDLYKKLINVRSTFINEFAGTEFDYRGKKITIFLRDTMLLSATGTSLRSIGNLVDVEKKTLDPDPKRHLQKIRNMDRVLLEEPANFEKYAINDALICVRYIQKILEVTKSVLNESSLPLTLTSIGVNLLLDSWERRGINKLNILGKEVISQRVWSTKFRRHVNKRDAVYKSLVHYEVDFATECYHGGRNEQFWFGPSYEADWTDYDLSSAYPTAMSLIQIPDWDNLRNTTDLRDFSLENLGYAEVEFEFPANTRYPVLPVRTDFGLIFPLKGRSCCCSPELILAKSMGAKIKVRRGLIIPIKSPEKPEYVFRDFIVDAVKKRIDAGKSSFLGLFWKEISNSTYGKTAQGLREKRVFDLKDLDTKPIPVSRITNPFYAAYITSMVRSCLGEILNSLDQNVTVFSCTTDGFLCDATDIEIDKAKSGIICNYFSKGCVAIKSDPNILEIKHKCKRLLGWRTRGQATLLPGDPSLGDKSIVLAKGGIYLPKDYETVESQNQYILDRFFYRSPNDEIEILSKTGIRQIVMDGSDLVEVGFTKKLNMEFDWKRRPKSVGYSDDWKHICFETVPWKSYTEFSEIRESWEIYTSKSGGCLKSISDYDQFAGFHQTRTSLPPENRTYLKKTDGDISRLRKLLCSAWYRCIGGITKTMTNYEFADLLNISGVPCTEKNVENGKRQEFVSNSVPRTPAVYSVFKKLKSEFPNIDESLFLSNYSGNDLSILRKKSGVATSRVT